MHDEEVLEITIERQGKGAEQQFLVHCTGVIAANDGAIGYTARGLLIMDRLLAAYPDVRVEPIPNDYDTLNVTPGTQLGWAEVRGIDLCRIILQWEPLMVEIGSGPGMREILLRTSRQLQPEEKAALHAELRIVAKLLTEFHGGSPLYSLVPTLGTPTVAHTVLLRFLQARNATRG